MDVGEDGTIQLSGYNGEKIDEAIAHIDAISAKSDRGGDREGGSDRPVYDGPEPQEGKLYKNCRVTGIHNFGVFCEILPGLEGMVHVSDLHTDRVRNCEGFMKGRDLEEIDVVCLGKNDRGKLSLSRKKAVTGDHSGEPDPFADGANSAQVDPISEVTSSEEEDVIAAAIEEIMTLETK